MANIVNFCQMFCRDVRERSLGDVGVRSLWGYGIYDRFCGDDGDMGIWDAIAFLRECEEVRSPFWDGESDRF